MEKTYNIITIINTLAIIIIPIVAVIIGQWIQKKQNLRDDKIKIFKILMKDRFWGWTIVSNLVRNFVSEKSLKSIMLR